MEMEKNRGIPGKSKDKDTPDALRFKPMSDGLGLNHFADGLPYAPAHTRRKPVVQFNFPKDSPEVRLKSQTHTQTQTAVQVTEVLPLVVNAGGFRRIVAFGLDFVFSVAIFALIAWAGFTLNGFDLQALLMNRQGVSMFWPLTMLYLVVHFGYFLIQETTWQTTLGKALLGMRISSNSGLAILSRAICFFIAAIPFGVGLFWSLFDSKRRCWHDVITDSEVVLINK